MLRIVNPVGRAMMVTNPAKRKRRRGLKKGYKFKGILPHARSRRSGETSNKFGFGEKSMIRLHSGTRRKSGYKRKGNRKRYSRKRNEALAVDTKPATSILPNMKDITADASTVLVGAGAFMANHGVGVAVNKIVDMLPAEMKGSVGGVMGIVKFAGRYLGARLLSSKVFTQGKGLLSKDNGVFVKNIITISAGVALLNDTFKIKDMLPAAVKDYWPNLQGYESGIHRGQLSRYRRLRAYESGIRQKQLSGYTSVPSRADLSGGNYENMPTERVEVSTHNIPWGA